MSDRNAYADRGRACQADIGWPDRETRRLDLHRMSPDDHVAACATAAIDAYLAISRPPLDAEPDASLWSN